MEKVVVNSYEEFAQLLGKQIGVSDYVEMGQDRINQFADATLDHQWIHVDPERAELESPYGCTIVHGYLTLSMLPYMWNQIIEVWSCRESGSENSSGCMDGEHYKSSWNHQDRDKIPDSD